MDHHYSRFHDKPTSSSRVVQNWQFNYISEFVLIKYFSYGYNNNTAHGTSKEEVIKGLNYSIIFFLKLFTTFKFVLQELFVDVESIGGNKELPNSNFNSSVMY